MVGVYVAFGKILFLNRKSQWHVFSFSAFVDLPECHELSVAVLENEIILVF